MATRLAAEDAAAQIVGMVDKDALIRSPHYAPLVQLREIARARSRSRRGRVPA